MRFGIAELYCGKSGKKGFYNSQEIGLARAMKKLGYEVYIFYPEKYLPHIKEDDVEENITVLYVPVKTFGNHSKYNWNIFLDYKIDVIQLGADNQIFAPALLKFCEKHSIKIYNFIGTTGTDSNNAIKSLLMNTLFIRNINEYRRHKNFVKTNDVMKAFLKWKIENVEVAHVGLDCSVIPKIKESKFELRSMHGMPLDKKLILFVGRLDAYKRPLLMTELMNALPNNYYGIMIGDGALSQQINLQINKLNLSDRIIQIKKIPNKEIHKYYKMADYFVNFNDHEIFGMSILEAMYQGCNVIAFHAPGPNEIIINGENGYLVSSIKEIGDIITSEAHIESNKAKQRILDSFIWEKTAQKINEWIKQ